MSKRKPHTHHLTLGGAIALLLAAMLAISATSATIVQAAKNLGYAEAEAACYVFALGAGYKDAEVHADRVRAEVLGNGQTTYIIGYQTGVLDTYAALHTGKVGTYTEARKLAADMLYKVRNCSTAGTF